MFDKFGPVEEVTVLRDDQGVSRGKYFSQSNLIQNISSTSIN